MTLIAQTFAPFSSKTKRYDQAGATYSVINQIGAPAVKRVVSDNNSRIYPLANRKLDVEPWEPYFYSTQLGRDVRKITFTDPSLRTLPFKFIEFDEVNEPYANTNKTGVPAVKRVVSDNNSRILPVVDRVFDDISFTYTSLEQVGVPPVKRVVSDNNSRILPVVDRFFDEISYLSYNWYNDIVRTGIGSKPFTGTTGIDGTSQRATNFKNIPYHVISYMSYNYWDDVKKTGLSYIGPNNASYVRSETGDQGLEVDGTSQSPANVNDSTNFSISNSLYPDIVQEGITLYKVTIDGDQSSVTFNNVRYVQSINYIYHDPPYRVGLPTEIGVAVYNDNQSIPVTVTRYHGQPLEGPYYVMTRVGLQMGNITGISIATNYQFWS